MLSIFGSIRGGPCNPGPYDYDNDYMKTIGVAELKAHLSRELRRVAAGESLIVTDHSRPIAVLAPLPSPLPLVNSAT